jgi:hypothetical protein
LVFYNKIILKVIYFIFYAKIFGKSLLTTIIYSFFKIIFIYKKDLNKILIYSCLVNYFNFKKVKYYVDILFFFS